MRPISKKERAWRLHLQGCKPAQIAQIIGSRRETVNVLLAQKRAELRKLNVRTANNVG